MRRHVLQPTGSSTDYKRPVQWRLALLVVCALVLLIGLLRSRSHDASKLAPVTAEPPRSSATTERRDTNSAPRPRSVRAAAVPAPTAEEIVATKLAQFAQSRRDLAYALARRHHLQVPADVEVFFAAVESGKWDQIEAAYKKINSGDKSVSHGPSRPADINPLWCAISDAYGAAEQVHLWPAQQLLDYGNAILGALKPGMVYVGGTDNGRWIPELLNDTSNGEQHMIVTQNGFADRMYLEYITELYQDRMTALTFEDSQRAFDDYLADARRRLEHDQQFPDEPKQVRPGEDIQMTENRVTVGGQVAVMSINERLLEALMQKNPDLSFAIQESYPFRETYADALPLGPLMELRATDGQNSFTPERAAESLDYWRNTAQQILSDSNEVASDSALKSYSHDAVAAANLLAAHNFPAEAEEAYRLGAQLWPANPEPVSALADLLAAGNRLDEARQLLENFARNYPDERKDLERFSSAMRLLWTTQSPGH